MAYLNFAEAGGGFKTAALPLTNRVEATFSPLEWSVIALAKSDRLSTLRVPGRVAKAMGSLFGTWRDSRLADERLEALRRMSVLAWRKSWNVPSVELRAFKAAGFTIEQYEALQLSVSRGREQIGKRAR